MRVLVVFEEEYRAYREVLAAGVQALRPGSRVSTTVPSDLENEIVHFDPQVIISSKAAIPGAGDAVTWIELPTDPSRMTIMSIGGRRFERSNPTLSTLLEMVDDAKKRYRLKGTATNGVAPAD